MLSDEYPEHDIRGPTSLGGTTFSMHLHVTDVDSSFERAVKAGATVMRPLKDQFYGERSGTVRDPFGHEWLLGRLDRGSIDRRDAAPLHRDVRKVAFRNARSASALNHGSDRSYKNGDQRFSIGR